MCRLWLGQFSHPHDSGICDPRLTVLRHTRLNEHQGLSQLNCAIQPSMYIRCYTAVLMCPTGKFKGNGHKDDKAHLKSAAVDWPSVGHPRNLAESECISKGESGHPFFRWLWDCSCMQVLTKLSAIINMNSIAAAQLSPQILIASIAMEEQLAEISYTLSCI